jgi:Icc-related predicted phosphoesterase
MKVLVIVDIHKSETGLRTVTEFIQKYKPDLLLIAGDITTFSPLEYVENFITGLPDIKTLALPGNCDPPEIIKVLDESSAVNLHGTKVTIEGITFVGLGGSNRTPFNTPFELTEDEILQTLDNIMEPGAILALHFPVKGHLDEVPRGEHTGSTSALKIVEKYQPSIVISGHIHETRGIKTDDNGIIYVNPGPLQSGYAAIINIQTNPNYLETGNNPRYDCKVQLLPEN